MERFIITDINRVVFVGKNEYIEKVTNFTRNELYHHELIYHFSGKAIVYFNGAKLITTKNTIRYLPAGKCTNYIVERETYGDCIDICFASNQPLSTEAFCIDVKNEKLASLFKKIFSIWVAKTEEYYLDCVSILYKIIAEIRKTGYLPEKQYEKIKPAIDYIHANFLSEETITSSKLVEICGISYSYIKKLFNLKYKISPKKYVLSLKMHYAGELLRHGENTVSQIAYMCGYKDIYNFSHQFKIEFGVSPTTFIKKYKSSK